MPGKPRRVYYARDNGELLCPWVKGRPGISNTLIITDFISTWNRDQAQYAWQAMAWNTYSSPSFSSSSSTRYRAQDHFNRSQLRTSYQYIHSHLSRVTHTSIPLHRSWRMRHKHAQQIIFSRTAVPSTANLIKTARRSPFENPNIGKAMVYATHFLPLLPSSQKFSLSDLTTQ